MHAFEGSKKYSNFEFAIQRFFNTFSQCTDASLEIISS